MPTTIPVNIGDLSLVVSHWVSPTAPHLSAGYAAEEVTPPGVHLPVSTSAIAVWCGKKNKRTSNSSSKTSSIYGLLYSNSYIGTLLTLLYRDSFGAPMSTPTNLPFRKKATSNSYYH